MTSISALRGQADNRRKPARARRTDRAALRLALTGDSIVERRLLTLKDATLRPPFDLIRGTDHGAGPTAQARQAPDLRARS